jgi:hypothetical protein
MRFWFVRRNVSWREEQWERTEAHLPTDVRGVDWVDDRRLISGIVHDMLFEEGAGRFEGSTVVISVLRS